MRLEKDHIHTYVRWGKKFGELHYKCADPDCMHFAPKSLILGKRSLCAICRQTQIILTPYHLKCARPRCDDCSNTKESQQKKRFKNVVADLFTQPELPAAELEKD